MRQADSRRCCSVPSAGVDALDDHRLCRTTTGARHQHAAESHLVLPVHVCGLPFIKLCSYARFILPAALVVTNDMNAYLFGFLFGKHPVINGFSSAVRSLM